MIAALDRLSGRGIDIKLARTPREAADHLHPEEQVLVFANAVVMLDAQLRPLVESNRAAVMILPEAWGRDRFERIDAVDNWAGVAVFPAPMIRETAAMLGDWAFSPTLIRRGIQQGVDRLPLRLTQEKEADEISPILREDLVGTARVLAQTADVSPDGLVEKHAMMPGLRRLAAWVALKPVSAAMLAFASLFLFLSSLGAGLAGFSASAFLLMLPANGLALLTLIVGQSGMPEPKPLTSILNARTLWLSLLLVCIGGRAVWASSGAETLFALCLWLAIQFLLLFHTRLRGAFWPEWRPGASGLALILGLSFGLGWPITGLAVCLAFAIAVQISVQRHSIGR
jgi:hypothetical protein